MRLFYDKQPVVGVNDLLSLYKPGEFESPARSTVALLSLVKHGGEVWNRMVRDLGVELAVADVHLEYTVKAPQGRGRPSHTDVMLIDRGRAVSLEAKWTEPRYATVSEWLNGGSTPDNRRAVMNGWLSLLQPCASRALHSTAFADAVYQMVHRAASACAAGSPCAMGYVQFTPRPDGARPDTTGLQDDLRRLHGILGNPAGFPFYVIEVEARQTPAFERIRGLPRASVETARTVRAGLLEAQFFVFSDFRLHAIRG